MPLPVNFGPPIITMRANDPLYTMALPPGGWYMGQRVPDSPLYSRYSEGVPANIPGDSLSPAPLSLAGKQLIATELTSTIPKGENEITIEFTRPLINEKAQEYLGLKGGLGSGVEVLEAFFEPIVTGMYVIYAGDNGTLGAPGGDSFSPTPQNFGTRDITVDNVANFAIGQWVVITNPVGGEIAIQKIESINGNILTFESDILIAVEGGAFVRTLNSVTTLNEGPDYSINLTNGEVSVADTLATRDKYIFIDYVTVCNDYDGADFWIVPGVHPITGTDDDYILPQQIPVATGAIQVGSSGPSDTSFTFLKSGNCLGHDYTLYAIAKDAETIPNPSLARAVPFTFIPARPTTITTEVGDGRVTIEWDDVTLDGSKADGYNVVRSNGPVFNGAGGQKVNQVAITALEFTDQSGAVNRVSDTELAPPVNGNTYSYVVESLVITALWGILTRNRRFDQTEVYTASKALSD